MDCSRPFAGVTLPHLCRSSAEAIWTPNIKQLHQSLKHTYIFLPSPWFSSKKLGSSPQVGCPTSISNPTPFLEMRAKMQHDFGRVIALQGRKQRLCEIHGIWERWWMDLGKVPTENPCGCGEILPKNPLKGQWFVSFEYLGDELGLSGGC